MSPNRKKHNEAHARYKQAEALPTVFNPHYHFAVTATQDRSLTTPTGPQFRTWQLVPTVRKRETVYS